MSFIEIFAPLMYLGTAWVVVSKRLLMDNPAGDKLDGWFPRVSFAIAGVTLLLAAASFEFAVPLSRELKLHSTTAFGAHVLITNLIRFGQEVQRKRSQHA